MIARALGVALVAGALGASVTAQGDRHELGLRLRAFERHLAAEPDAVRRDAAFLELERAVQAFFRLDVAGVGAAIDAADLALAGREVGGEERFARSLQLRLDRRLVDVRSDAVTAELRQLYEPEDASAPGESTFVWRPRAGAEWRRVPLDEVPSELELELGGLPAGDHELTWRLEVGGVVLVERAMALAAAVDVEARLGRVFAAAKAARKQRPRSVESATLAALGNLLRTTQRRAAYETELYGAALLAEAERLVAWSDGAREKARALYDRRRPGSFRLHVPVGGGTVATRLYAPEVDEGTRPIVVALHGAGGSENLFFDGYGDGLCVELARQRGWFVVSPRNGAGFVDCAGLVRALAARYPVDLDRVFVVGHSMGAMQTMRNVSRAPATFRAVAPIAGGGTVRGSDELARLPFFVCAGERDFGLRGSQRLHRAIEAAGATSSLRVYPAVEHLAIVQVALPDVFAFFDRHVQ